MEHRNALIVDAELTAADGYAERATAIDMLARRGSCGGEAERTDVGDEPGQQVSMRIRKRIEQPFGWIKTIAGGRKPRYRGQQRTRA
jgi:hypothetical protein